MRCGTWVPRGSSKPRRRGACGRRRTSWPPLCRRCGACRGGASGGRLPRRVDRIATALERGRLGGNLRITLDDRQQRFLAGLVQGAILAFLGAAIGIMSVLLLVRSNPGPVMFGSALLFDVLGYAGL